MLDKHDFIDIVSEVASILSTGEHTDTDRAIVITRLVEDVLKGHSGVDRQVHKDLRTKYDDLRTKYNDLRTKYAQLQDNKSDMWDDAYIEGVGRACEASEPVVEALLVKHLNTHYDYYHQMFHDGPSGKAKVIKEIRQVKRGDANGVGRVVTTLTAAKKAVEYVFARPNDPVRALREKGTE